MAEYPALAVIYEDDSIVKFATLSCFEIYIILRNKMRSRWLYLGGVVAKQKSNLNV